MEQGAANSGQASMGAPTQGKRTEAGDFRFLARQPILDRTVQLHGYELLFRAHDREHALVVDDEQATAHVLITSFVDLGIRAVVGGRWAAINVSRKLLLELAPLPFGPEQLVVELLEDQLIDDRLIERCAQIVAAGHTLALDDFRYAPEADPLLNIASIVKLDVRQHGIDGVREQMRQMSVITALDFLRRCLLDG